MRLPWHLETPWRVRKPEKKRTISPRLTWEKDDDKLESSEKIWASKIVSERGWSDLSPSQRKQENRQEYLKRDYTI
jgi:hypothetical protein